MERGRFTGMKGMILLVTAVNKGIAIAIGIGIDVGNVTIINYKFFVSKYHCVCSR